MNIVSRYWTVYIYRIKKQDAARLDDQLDLF